MKKVVIAIFGAVVFSTAVNAQAKKDTVAPEQKFMIVVTRSQWNFIDSTLQKSYYWIGRSMLVEKTEPLKNELASVLNFMGSAVLAQDTTGKKKK